MKTRINLPDQQRSITVGPKGSAVAVVIRDEIHNQQLTVILSREYADRLSDALADTSLLAAAPMPAGRRPRLKTIREQLKELRKHGLWRTPRERRRDRAARQEGAAEPPHHKDDF